MVEEVHDPVGSALPVPGASQSRNLEHEGLIASLARARARLSFMHDSFGVGSEDNEDLMYRFWHQSLKAYRMQEVTLQVSDALRDVVGRDLDVMYESMVSEGTGRIFTLSDNDDWVAALSPVVSAYMHSLHLLSLAVRYSGQLDAAPQVLPEGWATLLHLYRLR